MGLKIALISIVYQAWLYQMFFSSVLGRRYSRQFTNMATIMLMLALGGTGLLSIMWADTQMLQIKVIMAPIILFLYQCVVYKGTMKKKILAMLTLYGLLFVGELCVAQMVTFITKESLQMNVESRGMKLGYLLGMPIYIFLICILCAVWKRFENAEWSLFHWSQIGVCILFLLSQYIVLTEIFNYLIQGYMISVASILGITFSGIADILLFYAFQKQDKKMRVERKLQELKYLYEREELYFHEIEEHQKKMEKIRHDFKNQIAVIGYLVEKGDEESRMEAKRLAEQVRGELGR